ncbi:MAG: hypothetical protein Kow00109_01740 [Acidobacteriota bacterium]
MCHSTVDAIGPEIRRTPEQGMTLIEAIVAMGLLLIFLTTVAALMRPAADLSSLAQQRGEVQHNVRVGLNSMARELSLSGTGFPLGGVQLPAGSGAGPSVFACSFEECYVDDNQFMDRRLYAVTPGPGRGQVVEGVPTDVVTFAFRDDRYDLDQYPLVSLNTDGTVIEVDSRTSPPVTDPVVGIVPGDVLLLSNANGVAAAVVTAVGGNEIHLSPGDPLNFNQPEAEYGNVKALRNPDTGEYPPTRAFRIHVITYFVDARDQERPRLMRQVNAHRAEPVAEYIERLQISYDIFDDDSSAAVSDLPDANGRPNQIRKINLFVAGRSPQERLLGKGFDWTSMRTSVSARNLAFRDRYQ